MKSFIPNTQLLTMSKLPINFGHTSEAFQIPSATNHTYMPAHTHIPYNTHINTYIHPFIHSFIHVAATCPTSQGYEVEHAINSNCTLLQKRTVNIVFMARSTEFKRSYPPLTADVSHECRQRGGGFCHITTAARLLTTHTQSLREQVHFCVCSYKERV